MTGAIRTEATNVNLSSPLPETWHAARSFASIAGNRDFEFLRGSWIVENRRLMEPVDGSKRWALFHTIHRCAPLLNGRGYLHEIEGDGCEPAAMLCLVDAVRGRWSVYVTSGDGTLEEPMRGVFRTGAGSFVGRRLLRNRSVLVRHVWTRTATQTPEWTQSFSEDGGEKWEMNWTMRFLRAEWPD
jgi:hypothetical protein